MKDDVVRLVGAAFGIVLRTLLVALDRGERGLGLSALVVMCWQWFPQVFWHVGGACQYFLGLRRTSRVAI